MRSKMSLNFIMPIIKDPQSSHLESLPLYKVSVGNQIPFYVILFLYHLSRRVPRRDVIIRIVIILVNEIYL